MGNFSIWTDKEQLKKRIGYLPEHNPLYQEMPVLDYLTYVAELQGIRKEKIKERILEIYINMIEWGDGIYGVEAAAKTTGLLL